MKTDTQQLPESTSNRDSDELDLLALFGSLLRGWKTILLCALLGLVIGVLYNRYVTPTYQSDALIQIDENSKGVSGLGENISELIGPETSKSQAEAQLIKSRMTLEPVVDLLNLQIRLTDPSINALDRIMSSRINTQVNSTDGVALATDSGRAQVSQFNVAPAYIDQTFNLARSETGFTLSNEFEEYKGQIGEPVTFKGAEGDIQITVTELPTAQQPLTITKRSLQATTDALNNSLTVTEQGQLSGIIQLSLTGADQQQVSLILKEIVLSYVNKNEARGSEETNKTVSFMETQIPVLKQKLEESEALFNDFREKYGTIDVGREAELLLTENAQIDSQLNELKLNKAELTTYYTEEHPLVIQINDQLAVLNARKREINDTITRLPEIQREFLQLSEDVAINREIYLTMLKNYEQLKIVQAGQIGYARIVDLPVSSYNPIAPKKTLIMLLMLAIGTMLGMVIVLSKSLFKNVVKDPNRIEAKMGVPVVATIPRSKALHRLSKSNRATNRLLSYSDHDSLSYEAIKSLRTYLMLGLPKKDKSSTVGAAAVTSAQVIVITGESPNVGKSFICANLAEVFAQLDKKVLIIDADMRLGNLHGIFNIEKNVGLADYFTQTEEGVTDITHVTAIDNVDFIPRGAQTNNPSALLASDHFEKLMAQLRIHYDYIVIDSPPVLAASDAVILSKHADTVLMVTRYDNSLEGQLAYAIKQMNKGHVHVDGIVLNDMRQGVLAKRNYYYSYAYGNHK